MLWRESRSKAAAAAAVEVAAPVTSDHEANGPRLRVLYAGDLDQVRKQFASEAPMLELSPAGDVLGTPGGPVVFDVALIDCGSPGIKTATVLEQVRALTPPIPAVLVVDPAVAWSERVASDLHADDYAVKSAGWVSRVTTRLTMTVERHKRLRDGDSARSVQGRLRTIVESAPVCLARVRVDGTILAMNDAARAMIGAERGEQVLKKSLLAFVAPESTESARRYIESVGGGQPGSLELVMTSIAGVHRTIEASGVTLPADATGLTSALLALRDITDRRRLETSMLVKAMADRTTATDAEIAAQHDQERAELTTRLAEAEAQCQRVIAERDDLERSASEQAATLHALTLRQTDLEAEYQARLSEADSRLASAEAQLAQADAARAALQERTAEVVSRDEALAREADLEAEYCTRLNEAEARCTQALAERETLRIAAAEAAAAVEAITLRHADLEAEHRRCEPRVTELISALDAARATAGADAGAAQQERTAREALERQLHALEADYSKAVESCARLEHSLTATEAQRAAADAALRTERDGLQQRLLETEAECARLRREYDDRTDQDELDRQAAEDRIATLEGVRADLEAARAALELEVAARMAALTAAEQQLAQANAVMAAIAEERDRFRADAHEAAQARDAAVQAGDAAVRARDAAAHSRDAFEAELAAVQREHAAVLQNRGGVELALAEAERRHAAALADAEAVRGALQARLSDLETEHHRLREEYARLTEVNGRLHLDHEHLRGEYTRVYAERDTYRLERDDTQRQYAELGADRDRFRAERDRLEEAYQQAADERERVVEALARAEQERDRAQGEHDRVQQAHQLAQQEYERVRDEQARIVSERDRVRGQLEDLQQEREQLAADRDRLAAERDRLAADRDRLTEDRDQLADDRSGLAQERDRLQEACDRSQLEAEALEREHARRREEHDHDHAELRSRHDALQQAHARLQADTARLHEEHEAAVTERARLLGEQEELQRALAAAEAIGHQGLEQQLAALQATLTTLTADRDHLRQALQVAALPAAGADAARAAFEGVLRMATPHGGATGLPSTDGPTLAALDAVLDRIRRAESECRRAITERDEAQQTLRTLQGEIDRVFANRQAERQELLAAQQEAERFQQLAMQRMMKCAELERALFGARTEFDELTEWARVRSARITETLQPTEPTSGAAR